MEVVINTNVPAPHVAPESAWFKSSYSNDTGGACVEVAGLTDEVGIRDSKVRMGPALVVPTTAWHSFLGMVRSSGGSGLAD